MQGTDSENRTVSLGWTYLFQTYNNSIIDIFITVSESSLALISEDPQSEESHLHGMGKIYVELKLLV